ncbi:MAG: betaine/proline/choline family ABC transporter ATP-binding protein [Proteobacteria bacterium]|nr:betaine/proline/choline family ABC transporter ATP-binding protein [Pseudomonadota bacterium]NIS68478.1 betaine/proline/choline family ABC transporter ATP-binding protein [Pseudomonadota bacterium]
MSDQKGQPKGEIYLEVKSLWKVFGTTVRTLPDEFRELTKGEILEKTGMVLGLRDICFTVRRGEFFVIMGLSGSGKSTLIRCLLRLIEPTEGNILINGQNVCRFDVRALKELRRHTTSMVFQHFGLLPHYTVLENAAYGLKVRGDPVEERLARAHTALETVGLKGWENYKPGALSGGMQQRVGIARALATDPEIMLMDEPFSGLDPLIRRQMQDEYIELHKKVHKTVIFVTHDLHEALKLGNRIAIMRDGDILQLGTPEDVVMSPANDYVREFVQDASPSKILTASRIMEEPDFVLSEDHSVEAARKLLEDKGRDYAFLVTKKRKFLGLIPVGHLAAKGGKGMGSLHEAVLNDHPSCGPDTVVEDILPLAAATQFPIPVVDSERCFLGELQNRTILRNLITDKEKLKDV